MISEIEKISDFNVCDESLLSIHSVLANAMNNPKYNRDIKSVNL